MEVSKTGDRWAHSVKAIGPPAILPKRNGLSESAKKDAKQDVCNVLMGGDGGLRNEDGVSRLQDGGRLPRYVFYTCLLFVETLGRPKIVQARNPIEYL